VGGRGKREEWIKGRRAGEETHKEGKGRNIGKGGGGGKSGGKGGERKGRWARGGGERRRRGR